MSAASDPPGVVIPAEVSWAAARVELGEFRRAYVRLDKPGRKRAIPISTLYEFAEGVVYQPTAQPRTAVAFAWRTVVRIYLGAIRTTGNGRRTVAYQFTIFTAGGGRLAYGGRFEEFILAYRRRRHPENEERDLYLMLAASRRNVTRHLLPGARAALASGETVDFDQIKVSTAGLDTGAELLPWESVRSVGVVDGRLVVGAVGRRRPVVNLPSYDLPNELLFLILAEQLRKGPA